MEQRRAVFLVDLKGIVTYIQLVKEIGNEPNYDEVMDAIYRLKS